MTISLPQIAAQLAATLARKEAGQFVAAREELGRTCRQTIGLDLAALKELSPEAVAQLLASAGALRHIRAVTLAEILLLDAELPEADGGAGGLLSSQVHAACLLADSVGALDPEDQASYRAKLDRLADQLGHLRTHPYLQARLLNYGTRKNAA